MNLYTFLSSLCKLFTAFIKFTYNFNFWQLYQPFPVAGADPEKAPQQGLHGYKPGPSWSTPWWPCGCCSASRSWRTLSRWPSTPPPPYYSVYNGILWRTIMWRTSQWPSTPPPPHYSIYYWILWRTIIWRDTVTFKASFPIFLHI